MSKHHISLNKAIILTTVSASLLATTGLGVTQAQIIKIINLLALELEDNKLMRSICDLCKKRKTENLHVK